MQETLEDRAGREGGSPSPIVQGVPCDEIPRKTQLLGQGCPDA